MSVSPCNGCPPCCKSCIFAADGKSLPNPPTILLATAEYGCVRPDAGPLVLHETRLGMMRNSSFHPVTESGAEFLHSSGNPLAVYC